MFKKIKTMINVTNSTKYLKKNKFGKSVLKILKIIRTKIKGLKKS